MDTNLTPALHKRRALTQTLTVVTLVIQWLRRCLPMQGVQVRSLAGELRYHMPQGQKKKKSKTQNRSNIVTNSIKTLNTV